MGSGRKKFEAFALLRRHDKKRGEMNKRLEEVAQQIENGVPAFAELERFMLNKQSFDFLKRNKAFMQRFSELYRESIDLFAANRINVGRQLFVNYPLDHKTLSSDKANPAKSAMAKDSENFQAYVIQDIKNAAGMSKGEIDEERIIKLERYTQLLERFMVEGSFQNAYDLLYALNKFTGYHPYLSAEAKHSINEADTLFSSRNASTKYKGIRNLTLGTATPWFTAYNSSLISSGERGSDDPEFKKISKLLQNFNEQNQELLDKEGRVENRYGTISGDMDYSGSKFDPQINEKTNLKAAKQLSGLFAQLRNETSRQNADKKELLTKYEKIVQELDKFTVSEKKDALLSQLNAFTSRLTRTETVPGSIEIEEENLTQAEEKIKELQSGGAKEADLERYKNRIVEIQSRLDKLKQELESLLATQQQNLAGAKGIEKDIEVLATTPEQVSKDAVKIYLKDFPTLSSISDRIELTEQLMESSSSTESKEKLSGVLDNLRKMKEVFDSSGVVEIRNNKTSKTQDSPNLPKAKETKGYKEEKRAGKGKEVVGKKKKKSAKSNKPESAGTVKHDDKAPIEQEGGSYNPALLQMQRRRRQQPQVPPIGKFGEVQSMRPTRVQPDSHHSVNLTSRRSSVAEQAESYESMTKNQQTTPRTPKRRSIEKLEQEGRVTQSGLFKTQASHTDEQSSSQATKKGPHSPRGK